MPQEKLTPSFYPTTVHTHPKQWMPWYNTPGYCYLEQPAELHTAFFRGPGVRRL
jgi:hypothetical protein